MMLFSSSCSSPSLVVRSHQFSVIVETLKGRFDSHLPDSKIRKAGFVLADKNKKEGLKHLLTTEFLKTTGRFRIPGDQKG
jgi:hypothetical protein